MLRCSWCMKKLKEDEPCLGLGVKFVPGSDLLDNEGEIGSIYMISRNTSVPIIITAPSKGKWTRWYLCTLQRKMWIKNEEGR